MTAQAQAGEGERTALYRFYDADGRLLYVGITKNLKQRWYHHSVSQLWWPAVSRKEVEWWDTREAASVAEREAIRAERPLYNAAGNPAAGIKHPAWALFNPADRQRVKDSIRQEIISGVYPQGVDLHRPEIAARHSVAIRLVSSALRDLSREGLLIRTGNGNRFRVAPLD